MKGLVLILLTFKLFALEITLVNKDKGVKNFVAGDFLKVTLEVDPKSDIKNTEDFFKFLEKKELGQFSIINHGRVQESSERSDMLFIDMDIVLRDEVKGQSELFHTEQGLKIPIKLKRLNYQFVGFRPQVSILDLPLSQVKRLSRGIILTSILLMMIIGVILVRYYKKSKGHKNRQLEEIDQLFSNLRSRRQLELIYQRRKIWGPYVESELRESFYSILNGHQYKQSWSSEELDEVYQVAKKLEAKLP